MTDSSSPAKPETDMERRVREWHESDSTLELHEWLGMTEEEYARWLTNPGK